MSDRPRDMRTRLLEASEPPRSSDKLFTRSDRKRDVWVTSEAMHAQHRWLAYELGYFDAANILVEESLAAGPRRCVLVYPIVFLYRHYLELVLKKLVEDSQFLREEPFGKLVHHDLVALWHPIKEVLNRVWPDVPKTRVRAVESCITEMDKHSSDAWRYDRSTKGEPNLQGLDHFDLRNMRDVVGRLENFFTCVHEAINEFRDAQPNADF